MVGGVRVGNKKWVTRYAYPETKMGGKNCPRKTAQFSNDVDSTGPAQELKGKKAEAIGGKNVSSHIKINVHAQSRKNHQELRPIKIAPANNKEKPPEGGGGGGGICFQKE